MTTSLPSQSTTPRWRRRVVPVLVVLSSASIVAASLAVWTHRTALGTEPFMAAVGPAIEDPSFSSAVSDVVSRELLSVLDLEVRVTAALEELDTLVAGAVADFLDLSEWQRRLLGSIGRPSFGDLAPAIAADLEARIGRQVDAIFTSEHMQQALPVLVRRAHSGVVALIRDVPEEIPNVVITDDEVAVDLAPLVGRALQQVGDLLIGLIPDLNLPDVIADRADEARRQIETAIGGRLPEDFGRIIVISAEDLGGIRQWAQGFDRLVWMLVALAVGVTVATLWLSEKRTRTVIHLGLGVVIGLGASWLLIGRIRSTLVGALTETETWDAAQLVFSELFLDLQTTFLIVGVLAVVAVLAASLPSRRT